MKISRVEFIHTPLINGERVRSVTDGAHGVRWDMELQPGRLTITKPDSGRQWIVPPENCVFCIPALEADPMPDLPKIKRRGRPPGAASR